MCRAVLAALVWLLAAAPGGGTNARAQGPGAPAGEPIEGGRTPQSAVRAQPGQYLDSLEAGRARWYALDVERGERLFAAATIIAAPVRGPRLRAPVRVVLRDPRGVALLDSIQERAAGPTTVRTFAASMDEPAATGGRYTFGISAAPDGDRSPSPLPLEVTFGIAEGDGGGAGAARAGPAGAARGVQVSSDLPELAGVGGAALLLGAAAGVAAGRRRR